MELMFNRFTKFVMKNKIILTVIAVGVLSVTAVVFASYPSLLSIKVSSQKNALNNKKTTPKKEPSAKIIIAEKKYEINLNGGDMALPVKEVYVEPGASVTINGYPISDPCTIVGTVDVAKPGVYEISYSFKDAKVIRKVTVVDQIKPIIRLKGNSKIVFTVNDKFTDPGFSASDNLDGDLTAKVTTSGTVNTAIASKYTLTYSVQDSSGNKTSISRMITVNKKVVVKIIDPNVEKAPVPIVVAQMNEIGGMTFTGNGFKTSGKTDAPTHQLVVIDLNTNQEVLRTNSSVSGQSFQNDMNLNSLANGSYEMKFFNGSELKSCVDKLGPSQKILRAKVGNKLITLDYPDNRVCFKVEDFAYQYDVQINVGHGGSDPGTNSASGVTEMALNLEVSLYEKARYESMGLKVHLSRTTNDTYGNVMGDASLSILHRSAVAHGYYASVSKIAYSNHHNSAGSNTTAAGYEILVPAPATSAQLSTELAIANLFDQLFIYKNRSSYLYTKDYDLPANANPARDKRSGQVYTFRENFAMNRVPLELFNVKSVIYEGCYMSNPTEFNWYYNEGNWKKASEIKIKNYVESLGINYVPPVEIAQ